MHQHERLGEPWVRATVSRTVTPRRAPVGPGAPLTPAMMLALQQTAGNQAAVQRVARETPSMAGVKREVKSGTKGFKQRGFSQGAWPPSIHRRTTRSFAAAPDEQTLRHLSTQLYNYLHAEYDSGEQEIQAVWVNGGIAVAGNEDGSVHALYDELRQKIRKWLKGKGSPKKNPIRRLMGTTYNEKDLRAATVAKKQRRYFAHAGPRPVRPGAEALLVGLQANTLNQLTKRTLIAPSPSVDFTNLAGRIAFVTGEAEHAEQKLVIALKNANWTGPANIAGKKRPCLGCWLTLTYAKEKSGLAGLQFQGNAGGLWSTAYRGIALLAGANGATAESLEKWIRKKLPSVEANATMHINGKLPRNRPAPPPSGDLKGVDPDYGSGSDSD